MCLSSRCGAVVIVLLATWILRVVIHTSAKEADPIDITKLSFTVAGGVGAAAALVVAYRRQRDFAVSNASTFPAATCGCPTPRNWDPTTEQSSFSPNRAPATTDLPSGNKRSTSNTVRTTKRFR